MHFTSALDCCECTAKKIAGVSNGIGGSLGPRGSLNAVVSCACRLSHALNAKFLRFFEHGEDARGVEWLHTYFITERDESEQLASNSGRFTPG